MTSTSMIILVLCMTDDIRNNDSGPSIEYLNDISLLEKGEKIHLIWTYKDKTLDYFICISCDSMYEYVLDTVYYFGTK